jgi:hypothetical protein
MSHGLAVMAPSGFLSRLTKCQDVRLDPLDVPKVRFATVLARRHDLRSVHVVPSYQVVPQILTDD